MGLYILQETPVGYALLKAKSSKLLKKKGGFSGHDETAEEICSLLKLKDFHKFDSAATALEQSAALVEGKVTPQLAGLLDSIKDERKASLAVADPKLASAINKLPQFSLNLVSDSTTTDLYRSIRNHLPSLIPGLLPEDISSMSLGLSHSLSRHKLKFSTDKVDTMIIQAVSLLDDLDKELNVYAMRVKEWYGWHFPEMARIINDNLAYSRVILKMGMRTSAAKADLAEILPEEIEAAVKSAAEVSMGTEITKEDLDNIQSLAEQVVGFTEYRSQLSSYLSARMIAIAPNLTSLVGDLVGARLIAHAGSLMNLAKSPASTVQILGAEKALFRALKTKHDTPKYGLIYHASLIGQATGKNKGKIARMLATKATLGLRVDALADWSAEGEGKGDHITEEARSAFGLENRLKIERRVANLEGRPLRSKGVAIGPNGVSVTPGKWEIKEARKYNPDADGLGGDEPAAAVLEAPRLPNGQQKEAKLTEEVEEAISKELPQSSNASSENEGSSAEDEKAVTLRAMQAGLSVERYKRKLSRGEIRFTADGKAEAISKKDIKKARRAAEKAARTSNDISSLDQKPELGRPQKTAIGEEERARNRSSETLGKPGDSDSPPPKKRKRDQENGNGKEVERLEKKRRKKSRS